MGLLLIMNRGHYTNGDAVSKVIHYVTRTGDRIDRVADLHGYGGAGVGVYLEPDNMIKQFLVVQNSYGIKNRGGRRMYHEVFSLTDDEFKEIGCNISILNQIAMECSKIYFNQGHQVVYGVHYDEGKRWHIHFAVNTINFRTGAKWHTNIRETCRRERIFNEILSHFRNQLHPLRFNGIELLI